MTGYRIYIMDCSGDHIEDVDAIMADSDDEAIIAARRRHDRWELWQCGRLIQTCRGETRFAA